MKYSDVMSTAFSNKGIKPMEINVYGYDIE